MTDFKTVATFDNPKDAYAYLCKRAGTGDALISEGDWEDWEEHVRIIEPAGGFSLDSGDGHGNYGADRNSGKKGNIKRNIYGTWDVNLPVPAVPVEPEWVTVETFDLVTPEGFNNRVTYSVDERCGSFYIDTLQRKADEMRFDTPEYRYHIEDGKIIVEKKQ